MSNPTAKISHAVGFELSCPVDPSHEVEGPWGSISLVYTDEFGTDAGNAFCLNCGTSLSMPRIPKRVRTQEGN